MKTIVLFLLVTVPALAQNGFRTEKGKMVWEHTFTTATDVKAIVQGRDKMKILLNEGSFYAGKAEGVKNDAELSSVRLKSDASFDFTVTEVNGGYQVKVTNFMFLEKYGTMQLRIIPGSLDKYYLEYGKIRNSDKTKSDLGHVEDFLTTVFTQNAAPVTAETTTVAAK